MEVKRCTISQDKVFKIIEWILFIGFIMASGWFSQGVLQQFFSNKTSFAQYKEKVSDYPVVYIVINCPDSEINLSYWDVKYKASGMAGYQNLTLGENHLPNDNYNKTEIIIFESIDNSRKTKKNSFRIIHKTPIIQKNMPSVDIVQYIAKNKTSSSKCTNTVHFYITSQTNSPGSSFWEWKDGKPLQMTLDKNSKMKYLIQPQTTKYLEETGECQPKPYYECIASQLDEMEFNNCSNKCIPKAFSNLGRNYITPFCEDDSDNECARKIVENINEQKIASNCKKSCSNLAYNGQIVGIKQSSSKKGKNWNKYHLRYLLNNPDFEAMVYEEYYIYDTIGMIGAVGGTLGNITITYISKLNL